MIELLAANVTSTAHNRRSCKIPKDKFDDLSMKILRDRYVGFAL